MSRDQGFPAVIASNASIRTKRLDAACYGQPPLRPLGKGETMSAFMFGLIMGGSVGIPLACAIASRRKARKEVQDGSKDLPDGTEDDEG